MDRPLSTRAVLLWAALAVAVLGAPPHAEGALPPYYGGSVTLPSPQGLRLPDPTRISDPFEASLVAAVYDPLYAIDDLGRPRPALAERRPEREGLLARIPLRQGLRDQAGGAVRAAQVAASLRRAARSPARWLLGGFARQGGQLDVRVVDDQTVALRLARADVLVATTLAALPLSVVTGRDPARAPAGTGPFRARLSGSELRLTAFRRAAEGEGYLGTVALVPPGSRESELRDFELGRLDGSWYGGSLYGRAPGDVRSTASLPVVPVLLVPRTTRGPLREPGALGALARAVDRRRLERAGLSASERLAAGLPTPAVPAATARSSRVTLRMPVAQDDPFAIRVAEALAGMLDEAGFALSVERVPAERLDAARASADLSLVTVVPPLPGRVALVGAALAAAGQLSEAEALLRDGGLRDDARAARAATGLHALVLGHRQIRLFHHQALRGVGFDPRGFLDLRALHQDRSGNANGGAE